MLEVNGEEMFNVRNCFLTMDSNFGDAAIGEIAIEETVTVDAFPALNEYL